MADDKELVVKIKGLDELTPIMTKALASMEASANKLADSVNKVNAPLDNVAHGAEGLNSKLINLASGMEIIKTVVEAGAKAWEMVSEQVMHAIEEAVQAEKAENQLTGALVSQGLYLQNNIDTLKEYIETKEKQTGIDGEVIKTMIAQSIQMGLSVEKAKEMEEASRKLAAATGVDVMTAFSQMQGAMNGQTRGLAKVIPQVKELTEAQLKNGAAISLVNQSLDAQYNLYQGSFSASLARANTAINEVYKNFGAIIIQNPLVIKGLNLFTEWMSKIADAAKTAGEWVEKHQAQIEAFGTALFQAMQIGAVALGIWAVAAAAAAIPTITLAGAIALLASPITLTVVAVGALTAAFYKWPGLFDQIVGSFKIFVGFFLEGIGYIADKAATLISIFDKDMAASLKGISKGIEDQSAKWQLAGVAQTEYGDNANKAADIAVGALDKEGKKIDETLAKQNSLNAAKKEATKSYGGVNEGTDKNRQEDKAAVSTRDKDLKDFQEFLDQKKRLAITSEQEQQMEINKVRAGAIGGDNMSGQQAKQQVEIDAETKKQSDLAVLRQRGIINEAQYQDALTESQNKQSNLRVQQAQAQELELANAMGTSEEAFQIKQDLEQERFDNELAQKIERADQLGATQAEINSMTEQAELEHTAKMNETQAQYWDNQAQMQQQAGNDWEAFQARMQAAQQRQGVVMGTLQTVQNSGYYKAEMGMLNNLASLRNSKSKSAFELGKKAAIASATIQTALAATEAFASLATIPIVGPVLGAAAAAAAIAAGVVQIQNIQSQQFGGGQADEGMDSIPGSLAGKSFVLSQGERVVQPEANKDLTNFLSKEKGSNGGGGKGQTINITLNYGGIGSKDDAKNMAEILVKEIRSMSEKGTPIMSDKGIVKSS